MTPTNTNSVSPLSRRSFLKLGTAGVFGVAVLGAIERVLPPAGVSDVSVRRMPAGPLTASEFHTLDLFAATVIGAPADALSTHDACTAERIELELTRNQGVFVKDFKAALKVVEYLPVVWGMRARFTRLSEDARLSFIRRMSQSDVDMVRSSLKGLRFMCLLCYYTDERNWKRMGYVGAWVPAKFYEGGNTIVNLQRLKNPGASK